MLVAATKREERALFCTSRRIGTGQVGKPTSQRRLQGGAPVVLAWSMDGGGLAAWRTEYLTGSFLARPWGRGARKGFAARGTSGFFLEKVEQRRTKAGAQPG